MILAGKNAIVTGAGRNQGKAIAIEFARQGANVVVNNRANSHEAEQVAAEARQFGVRVLPLTADVSKREEVHRLIDAARSAFGEVDILVHTVAVRPTTPFLEIDDEEWDRVLTINLRSAFYCTQAVLPSMVAHKYGRIILFSGLFAFTGAGGRTHVMASKTGILGLVRGLAAEFAASGVTVNCVAPGVIDTVRAEEWWPGKPALGGAWSAEELLKHIPVGRVGDVSEIAAACAFLASERAGFITGQTIHVNGGQYVG